MNPNDVQTAITNSLVQGGSQWLIATIVAFLPALWTMALMLHLGRPYVLRTLRRFRPATTSKRIFSNGSASSGGRASTHLPVIPRCEKTRAPAPPRAAGSSTMRSHLPRLSIAVTRRPRLVSRSIRPVDHG